MVRLLTLTASLLLATPALAQESSALEAAYQKEFAYLVAEKKALETRLSEIRTSSAATVAASEAELERLEARHIASGLDLERQESLLENIDREVDGMAEATEALDATLVAARATLDNDSFNLGEKPEAFTATVAQLGKAFSEGEQRVRAGRSVQVASGDFFLGDGTQVSGQIAQVGNVAAYGVSDQGSGALVPAGDGRLRVWKDPADAAANSVVDGATQGAVLPVYLFETMEKRIEDPPQKGLQQKVRAGGVVGMVILALGLAALVLVVLRGLALTMHGRGGDVLVARVADAMRANDVATARKLVAGGGSMSRVVGAVLPQFWNGREAIENAATEAILLEQPKLERFGAAVTVIAAVAPLLGLLGTVTGMISTFDVITEFGTGDPKMLSGGISEALVTTQLGLVVAIPCLLAGNLLSAWSTRVMDAVERGALHLANLAPARPGDPLPAPSVGEGASMQAPGLVAEAK